MIVDTPLKSPQLKRAQFSVQMQERECSAVSTESGSFSLVTARVRRCELY